MVNLMNKFELHGLSKWRVPVYGDTILWIKLMLEFYISKCFIKGLPIRLVHQSSVHLSKQGKTSRTSRYKIAVTRALFYHFDPFSATPSVATRMSYRPLICPLILVTVSTNFLNDYDGDKMVSSSTKLHFHRWKHKSEPTFGTKRYKTL